MNQNSILKELPVGVLDYKELILNNYYYIDKTLLVAQIWHAGKVVLIPRPRRFGKTINLSMLRYFFEQAEINHELLFGQSELLKKHPEYRELMGKFPVIFLTFKDVGYALWKDSYQCFNDIIQQEFKRHMYLLDSLTLSSDRALFLRLIEGAATYTELSLSLLFLTRLLGCHGNKIVRQFMRNVGGKSRKHGVRLKKGHLCVCDL